MVQDAKRNRFSRRTFMVMASAFACSGPSLKSAVAATGNLSPVIWKGGALGAQGVIELYHPDQQAAREALWRCQQEIDRLEELFSLYRSNSAISRLNRDGFINDPDIRFLELVSAAQAFSEQTNGVFDITIQPLWKFYASHFSNQSSRQQQRPPKDEIQKILDRTGYQHMAISGRRISFKKPGMAITLNGIAQGYITDRIKLLLEDAGFKNVLLSLGEITTIGPKPDGTAWQVGLERGYGDTAEQAVISLENQAVATSGGYASPFNNSSSANHLLHPKTGNWSVQEGSVSVVAKEAMIADMSSTALSLMNRDEQRRFLSAQKQIQAVYFSSEKDGQNWTA